MGFFDLFRKKKQEEVKEIEKISFSELDSWIENKDNFLEEGNNKYLSLVDDRKEKLIDELNSGINGLNNVNWDKIKAEDRVKTIVKENLVNYIGHLENLGKDLKKAENKREMIENVFSGFDKRAGMSYQKATFLIGKEMGAIDESVGNFFKDLKKIEEENIDLVKEIDVINKTKEKYQGIKVVDKKLTEANKNVENIDKKIELVRNKIRELNSDIAEMKNNEEYKNWEQKKEKQDNNKRKLDLMIIDLRKNIDFKKLARDWHKNEKEMKLVKSFKENFVESFEKFNEENLKKIIVMLDNKSLILEKINLIIEFKDKINNIELEEDLTLGFVDEIGKLEKEIEVLGMDKERDKKRIEKFDIEMVRLKGEIGGVLRGVVDFGD